MASTISAGTTTTTSLVYTADTSGVLQLQTNGTTTAVTIDTAQNVGIGVTPSYKLDVNGTIHSSVSSGNNLLLDKTAGAAITLNVNGNSGAFLGTQSSGGLQIYTANGSGGALAQVALFDNSGNLLVGTTTTNGRLTLKQSTLDFDGGFTSARSDLANVWGLVTGGDNKFYIGYATSGKPAAVGNFATNGTYTATSDIRKKKDISYEFNGLEFVTALKPAMGRMLDDDNEHPLRPFFIAQDIQTVLPSLVSSLEPDQTVQNPILGVDYASVAPVLVKAIQELSAKVTALEAKVA